MVLINRHRLVFAFIILYGLCARWTLADDCPKDKKAVVCYWASWAVYRDGYGNHTIGHIDPAYCTHLVYSFAGLNLGGGIDSLDLITDITMGGYKKFVALKEQNPCLKTLIAFGGWNEGSEKYSYMAETNDRRELFAEAVVRFLIFYEFDGVDLDWEYPGHRRGLPDDKDNFSLLVEKLHNKLKHRNRILTVAVSAAKEIMADAYDFTQICKFADFVNVMGYDLHLSNATSSHAPLRRELDELPTRDFLESTIHYLKSNGCESKKLILGIPAYGRTFTLKDPSKNGLGEYVEGPGDPGPLTLSSGFLGFHEICGDVTEANGWTIEYLHENAAKYAYRDNQWVTYDDQETIKQKVKFILDEQLAGVMFWSIDTDDFAGECFSEPYPLLVAANMALGNAIPSKASNSAELQ